eukprot:6527265-Ditylum_brightwellii.AAC.1
MAHKENATNNGYAGYFHDNFNPGPQGDEVPWIQVKNGSQKKKEEKKSTKAGEKRKINVNVLNIKKNGNPVEVTNETVHEQIKTVGEKDIGERTRYTSRLRVEFNLGFRNKTFKARNELLHLVHKLAITDNAVYVKSKKGKGIWTDDKKFPSKEAFKEEFRLR